MTTKPISITANRQKKELTVIWDDGHESVYSFELLRAGCPCAECRGGHENMGSEPPPEAFETHIDDEKKITLVNIDDNVEVLIRAMVFGQQTTENILENRHHRCPVNTLKLPEL